MSGKIHIEAWYVSPALRRISLRLTALCCTLVVAACLSSKTPIFGEQDARALPGITGKWEQIDNGPQRTTVFVTRQSPRAYKMVVSEFGGRSVSSYENALLIPLENNYFVLQANNAKAKSANMMLLVRVANGHVVMEDFKNGDFSGTLTKHGLKANLARTLEPGVTKEKILGVYRTARSDKNLEPTKVLKRMGGFVDADGRDKTIAAAQAALDREDFQRAYSILRYLADRGNADAQAALSEFYLNPKFGMQSYAKAVATLEDAWLNGSSGAGLVLSMVYMVGPGAKSYGNDAPSGPNAEFSKAFSVAWKLAKDPQVGLLARNQLKAIAKEKCQRMGGKTRQSDCIAVTLKLSENVALARDKAQQAGERVVALSLKLANIRHKLIDLNARKADSQR